MNMKLLLEIIIVVSVLLLCAVAPYHIFQSYKKRAIGTLKDYERFLVNVNEYVHGQILASSTIP